MHRARAVLVVLLLTVIHAQAVSVDQAAPGFTLSTHVGGTFSLAGQSGKVVALLFLGCT